MINNTTTTTIIITAIITTDPTTTEIETKVRLETKPELAGLRRIRLLAPFKGNQDNLTPDLRNL